jgi:hypothetical protein
MSSDYVLDVLDIRYVEEQAYKRHFEWVWHAFGDLTLDGVKQDLWGAGQEVIQSDWSATWLDSSDGIGLKTTMLGSAPRKGSTKVDVRQNEFGSYLKVFRGNYRESFIAIHEPFRSEPKIDQISRLSEGDGTVAIKIVDEEKYTDYLCVAFAADAVSFDIDGEAMVVDGNYGYLRVADGRITARGSIESFRIHAPDTTEVILNGVQIKVKRSGDYVVYRR